MEDKFFAGICQMVRGMVWIVIFLSVAAVAFPVMALWLLVDAVKGNE